jgi:hypothetical protein
MRTLAKRALHEQVVCNQRPVVDWNTCGQAAIATLRRIHGLHDVAGEDHGAAIDRVRAHFPPDLPFGLGTSPRRLVAALEASGLEAEVIHSGWFGRRIGRAWERLVVEFERGMPAIVCLDGRHAGNVRWSAHWAVALGMDERGIRLGNVGQDAHWSFARFEKAWACRHLPVGYNHLAVLARLPARPGDHSSPRGDHSAASSWNGERSPVT